MRLVDDAGMMTRVWHHEPVEGNLELFEEAHVGEVVVVVETAGANPDENRW